MTDDRQTKNAASEGTSASLCWLCRVIGHKWVTRRKYSVDGVSMSDTVLWGCCVRCGRPTPDRIMDATANAPADLPAVAVRSGGMLGEPELKY